MLPDFRTSFSSLDGVKSCENLLFSCVNVCDGPVYCFDCQRGGQVSPRSFPHRSVLCGWLSAARLSTLTNWPTVSSFREWEVGVEHVMDRCGNHCNSDGEAGLLLRCRRVGRWEMVSYQNCPWRFSCVCMCVGEFARKPYLLRLLIEFFFNCCDPVNK